MKEMINEKLKNLADTQGHIEKISDIIELWDNSQLYMEKTIFDSLNNADRLINLSKDGRKLTSQLLECCKSLEETSDPTTLAKIIKMVEETETIFSKLVTSSKETSEISHNLEEHVAYQRQASEEFIDTISQIKVNVDETVACAEFLLTEL